MFAAFVRCARWGPNPSSTLIPSVMRAWNIHAPHFTSSSIWKANDTDPERYDQDLSGAVSLAP